jgi:hypothetical protein
MDDDGEEDEEIQHWRKRMVQKDDPSRNIGLNDGGDTVNGGVLPTALEEEETSDNERQQVLHLDQHILICNLGRFYNIGKGLLRIINL